MLATNSVNRVLNSNKRIKEEIVTHIFEVSKYQVKNDVLGICGLRIKWNFPLVLIYVPVDTPV